MSQCPTCGFDAPLATCLLCRGREVLREARRAELRAHLDRGLTPRPRWWRPGDPEWLPVNARTWRDFEGSEGAQESTPEAPTCAMCGEAERVLMRVGDEWRCVGECAMGRPVADVAPGATNGENPSSRQVSEDEQP